jgi:hypothetical protein
MKPEKSLGSTVRTSSRDVGHKGWLKTDDRDVAGNGTLGAIFLTSTARCCGVELELNDPQYL